MFRRKFQYLAMLTGSLNIINSGMHYGWASPSLPQLLAEDSPIPITDDEGSWLAVMFLLGIILGAILVGIVLDKIGRKSVILLSSLPFIVSWMMLAFARSIEVLLAARFVAGIGDGLIFCSMPVYVSEIADPSVRGLLGSGISVTWIFGMLLVNIAGSYLTIQTTALICTIFPLLVLVTFPWMPESPYYLIMKGTLERAQKSLATFKGTHEIEEEMKKLVQVLDEQNKNVGRYLDLFTVKSNIKALYIILGLKSAQQLTGTTAIMFYSQIIVAASGDSISPSTGSIIYFTVQVLLSGCSSMLVDRTGRRPLMIVSITGSGLALLVLACYFYVQNETEIDTASFSFVPVLALIGFVIIYNMGMQTTPILMLGEVFPTNVKAFATSFADIYFSVLSTAVSKFFQITKDSFGMHVPFFVFAFNCVLALIFIVWVVPETKGKTLEDIQDQLKGKGAVVGK